MPINFSLRLIAVLAAVLALGANGQRGGGGKGGGGGGGGGKGSGGKGSGGGNAEPGCCYGLSSKCDELSQTKCEAMVSTSTRKGCEWRSGEDADCTESSSSEEIPEGYTVVCGSRECRKETIDCPKTGPCTVVCEDNGCEDTTVNCPDSYDCDISCVAEKGGYNCYEAIFNWAETPGLGSLECSGWYACIDVDFPEPEPTVPLDIVCTEFRECEGTTIRCPAEADCSLTCVDGSACRYAKLICPENHECNVECRNKNTYGAACDAMNVQWSSTPGLGSLTCIESGACDGVNSPPTVAKEQVMSLASLPVVARPNVLLSESLLLVAGACVVLAALVTAFYVYDRKSKKLQASWDNEE